MPETVRVGIIGTGIIAGKGHMPGIVSHPGAVAVAACDADSERLEAFATEWGIGERFTNWEDLIRSPNLDAVCICLPNTLHATVTQAALREGLAVMCEKPMALTSEDADAMVETATESGSLLAIKVHNRCRMSSLRAKELIASGALGEIYHAEVRAYRRSGIPGIGSWFTQREYSGGGALADSGIHPLDTAYWLLGAPDLVSVSGEVSDRIGRLAASGQESVAGQGLASHQSRTQDPGTRIFDVEDGAFGLVRLDGGRAITVSATWSAAIDEVETINIFGTLGGVQLNWSDGGDVLKVFGMTESGDQIDVFDAPGDPDALIPWSAAHERATHDFIDAVADKLPSPVDPKSVANVTRAIQSVYRSAELGHEINF